MGAGKSGKGKAAQEYLSAIRIRTSKVRISMSARAGLQLPVSRFRKMMKKENPGFRVGPSACIYITSVIEYLVAEVVELAGNAATDHRKKRISPRHMQLAIRNDNELDTLFKNVIISQGGIVPHIHPILL